jgi:hypothetical protein
MPTGSWARNARSERSRFRAAISPVCLRRAAHPLRASTWRNWWGPAGIFPLGPNLYQPACKPGSVWRAWLDARVTAIPLRRQLPDAFSNLPGRRDPDIDPGDCSLLAQPAAPVPSLFGLAPGGVCPAACVAAGAVRSYRTFSPLPLRPSSAYAGAPGRRSVLCGTFPRLAPAGRYPAPYVHGARTFLSDLPFGVGPSSRPAD